MRGIVSYGFYIPKYRITTETIARENNKKSEDIIASLGLKSKAVAARDEDTATMAIEAASTALKNIKKNDIDLVLFGSETHPYAVKPTASIVADWLDVGNNEYNAYDTQFACKAGTGALLSSFSAVAAGDVRLALVCAADKATGKPGDALEYSAGSGAVAFVTGTENVMLEVLGTSSYTSDTPDFWRRHGMAHPSHAGRFTAKPAYYKHTYSASSQLLEKIKMEPEQFTHAVFHMPNGRFPKEIAKKLGFSPTQVEKSLIVSELGNSYAGSALMGLVATLEYAHEGDTIFFASYGSGAGSDAIAFKVTKEIENRRLSFRQHIQEFRDVGYIQYLKMLKAI